MATQIAVKLPEALLGELDRLVRDGCFESRSQGVRRGIEAVVESHRRGVIDRGYAEAYARFPETDAEMAEATRLAIESINEEPWERWW